MLKLELKELMKQLDAVNLAARRDRESLGQRIAQLEAKETAALTKQPKACVPPLPRRRPDPNPNPKEEELSHAPQDLLGAVTQARGRTAQAAAPNPTTVTQQELSEPTGPAADVTDADAIAEVELAEAGEFGAP